MSQTDRQVQFVIHPDSVRAVAADDKSSPEEHLTVFNCQIETDIFGAVAKQCVYGG